jgi:hypothetical protein
MNKPPTDEELTALRNRLDEWEGANVALQKLVTAGCDDVSFGGGRPTDTLITPDHLFGPVLPIGRKMTRPVTLSVTDLDGTDHECVEAFDTKHNVIILLYPVHALTTTTIILPTGFKQRCTG